ncbi:hypothetical protein LTR56_000159 [Elasticomyces elasticus]|nr:hypothetical protein LTR56_000159 [Elasticomyces elasticus]KAK3667147.1 hypothetical protein LTR22_002012 [Elasticomyces elasticus]KAK4932921.1 hypothetical protein LTR49_000878 [Elasticomyces elasticus]KAK5768674.1 hypothetical protein LTS12_001099 [Elasticomyces elasticus]
MSAQHSRFFGPQAIDQPAGLFPKRIDYTTPILNRIEQLTPRSGPAAFAKSNAFHTRRWDLGQSAYPAVEQAEKSDVEVCTTIIRVQQLRDLVNPLEQDSSSLAILQSTLRVSGAFTDDEEVLNNNANQTTEIRHYHDGFCTVSMRTNHGTMDLVDGLQMRNRCPRCRCIEQGLAAGAEARRMSRADFIEVRPVSEPTRETHMATWPAQSMQDNLERGRRPRGRAWQRRNGVPRGHYRVNHFQ